MAISDAQKVDLLYKKAFGVTKTDNSTNKGASNESIASPLFIRGDTVWTQSSQIPGTAGALAGIVQAYTGATAVQCTADTTSVPISTIYPTWKTNLTDWIPPEFGATYFVQVWVDTTGNTNPTTAGTQIFAAGSGGTGEWNFDPVAGVLNFIGQTIPTALVAGKSIFVIGYRYIGLKGTTNLPTNTTIGNINITGNVISSTNTNGNVVITPNGTGQVVVNSNLISSGNITATNFIGNVVGNISGSITVSGANTNILFNDQGNANAVAAFSFDKATSVVTATGNINAGNISATNHTGTTVNVTGQLISTVATSTSPFVVTSTTQVANLYATRAAVADTSTISTGTTGNYYLTMTSATTGNVAPVANASILANLTTGTLYATKFMGDGGLLSNMAATNSIANGTSNVAIVASGGNVNLSVSGTANVLVVTGTGANIAGTLNVTGNANVGNIGATNHVGTTVNVTGQLISTIATGTAPLIVNSTTTVANLAAATAGSATTAGTVTTAAQPNITSVGTLTALLVGNGTANVNLVNGSNGNMSVTGNITSGNLSVTANANVGNIGSSGVIVATGNITSSANVITDNILGRTAAVTVTAAGTNTNINLVPNGTGTVDVASKRITSVATPTATTDAVNKAYVDAAAASLNVHQAVEAASTVALTVTYNNGTAGVGATLTNAGTLAAFAIDGYSPPVGARVLIKNQATTFQNGVYDVTTVGSGAVAWVLTRSADFDNSPTTEVHAGVFVFVSEGGQAGTGWVETAIGTGSPGDYLVIGTDAVAFTQFSGTGTYTNGTGLTLTGTQFKITDTAVTPTSYGSSTAIPTFTVNQQGQLTNAGTAAVIAPAGTLSGTTLNSTVVNSSLTSVGSLGTLTVTGNANVGNIGATNHVGTTVNVTGQLISTITTGTAPLIVSSTTTVANLAAATAGSATTAGTVTTAAQPNITSTGTLTSLTVTGNVAAGNVTTTGQLVSSVVTGTAPLIVSSTTTVANLAAATAGTATTAGTVTTAAQPNITSVGTLTGLTSSGVVNITNATDTTSNITGALIITGGAVVDKSIFIQGEIIEATTAGVKVMQSDVVQTALATVTATAIDSWAIASFRSAKYMVQITQGTNYQISEVLVIHNGTTTSMTEYGVIETNGALATLTSDVTGGTTARLLVTMGTASAATINVARIAMLV